MDDQQKIGALMVYYHHWGKDEINARKIVEGMISTMKMLEKEYVYESMSLTECLRSLFYQYSGEHITNLYKDLIGVFLKNYGGFYDDNWDIDYNYAEHTHDTLYRKKFLLDCDMGTLSDMSMNILYNDDFNEEHLLSVNSILSLQPIERKNAKYKKR